MIKMPTVGNALQIFFAIVAGNILGYQYAKWKHHGKINVLFWEMKNPEVKKWT